MALTPRGESDPEPTANQIDGVYSRRHFLRVAGGATTALVGGGMLAACGGSAGSSTKLGGPFDLYTWQGYDLTQPYASWRKHHNIVQHVKYIQVQADVAAVLKGPGGHQIDASSANQSFTNYFQKLGLTSPITTDEVPGLKEMYPFFRNSSIWRNSDGTYNSVPWSWGATALNWRKGAVPEPTSWQVVLDPKYKGRVGTLDDPYNNISVATIAVGLDLAKLTKQQLNGPVKTWLLRLIGQLKSLSPSIGDQSSLLNSGEVDYMVIGDADIVVFAQQAGVTDIGFTVPEEGGFGYVDATFITPWAKDLANAVAYCNQLIQGASGAAAQNANLGGTTNPSVVPLLNAQTRGLYPYAGLNDYLTKRLHLTTNYFSSDPSLATYQDIQNLWEEVKS
jgi:spermidine/putrescine-binding protein